MTAWDICLQQLAACAKSNLTRGCPPHQAEALRLREAGHNTQEIARAMGLTPSGAESLLKRADRRVRVLEGLRAGRDPRTIADDMNMSLQAISQIINQAKELGHGN